MKQTHRERERERQRERERERERIERIERRERIERERVCVCVSAVRGFNDGNADININSFLQTDTQTYRQSPPSLS